MVSVSPAGYAAYLADRNQRLLEGGPAAAGYFLVSIQTRGTGRVV